MSDLLQTIRNFVSNRLGFRRTTENFEGSQVGKALGVGAILMAVIVVALFILNS